MGINISQVLVQIYYIILHDFSKCMFQNMKTKNFVFKFKDVLLIRVKRFKFPIFLNFFGIENLL